MSVLRALGVGAQSVASEASAMEEVAFASTANRRVLGSLNDFRRMLPSYLERGEALLEASLELAEAPCGPIGMARPRDVTIELFSSGRG